MYLDTEVGCRPSPGVRFQSRQLLHIVDDETSQQDFGHQCRFWCKDSTVTKKKSQNLLLMVEEEEQREYAKKQGQYLSEKKKQK